MGFLPGNHPTLESVYPFTSGTGDESTGCLYSGSKATNIKILNVEIIGCENPSQMKARVQKQPFIVTIAANNKYIHSYSSGIIDVDDCY